MKILLSITFFVVFSFCQEEDTRLPVHKIDTTIYKRINKFIPKGYVVLDQCDGDLNGDGLKDKILILREKQEVTSEENRPVIILLKMQNGSYKKIAENDNIVLHAGDGGIHGDPYHGITIKKDKFSIEHFGGSSWRWNQVITFKYNRIKLNWYLYTVGSESWHFDPSTNFTSELETGHSFGVVQFSDYKNKWLDKNG